LHMKRQSLDNLKKRINEKFREEGLPDILQIVRLRASEKTPAIEITDTLACPPRVLGCSSSDIEKAKKIRDEHIDKWFTEQGL